jgi:uncharacterized membrane protein
MRSDETCRPRWVEPLGLTVAVIGTVVMTVSLILSMSLWQLAAALLAGPAVVAWVIQLVATFET